MHVNLPETSSAPHVLNEWNEGMLQRHRKTRCRHLPHTFAPVHTGLALRVEIRRPAAAFETYARELGVNLPSSNAPARVMRSSHALSHPQSGGRCKYYHIAPRQEIDAHCQRILPRESIRKLEFVRRIRSGNYQNSPNRPLLKSRRKQPHAK